MSDSTMKNNESGSVQEQAATPDPMIVDDDQNPTASGSAGQTQKSHPAEVRRLAVRQQLQDLDRLAQVS
jgi:hypothetical protein